MRVMHHTVGIDGQGRRPGPGPLRAAVSLALLLILPGCATLQGVLALRQVEFSLDRLTEVRLAGVELERLQRYEDLGPLDAARLIQAASQGTLPLSFRLDVLADNPAGNPEARLLALDWTLFLQDRETVSGGLPDAVVIPAAGSTTFPLEVRLDLLEFFEGSARDLVNLALSLAGQEAPPTHVRLAATPTVSTPLGPIRYPGAITIASHRGGSLP
jgi:hypothetical protein